MKGPISNKGRWLPRKNTSCPLLSTCTHGDMHTQRREGRKKGEKKNRQTDRQTMVRKASLKKQPFNYRRQRGETVVLASLKNLRQGHALDSRHREGDMATTKGMLVRSEGRPGSAIHAELSSPISQPETCISCLHH